MVEIPLLVASLLAVAGGGVYALIGERFLRLARQAPMQAYFALYWLGVALYAVADGAWSLAVALFDPPLAVGIATLHVKILAGTAGFFGLVYYLTYLYTGRTELVRPLFAFYLLVLLYVTYSYAARQPIGQEVREWGSGLTYANPGGLLSKSAYALLFAPPLLAAVAYGALLPRASTRRRRLRILATSGSFAVFFGGLLLGWMTNVVPAWPILEKCLAIVVGLVVYATVPRGSPEREGEGPDADPDPPSPPTDGPRRAEG